ncbi:D-2-hydroxyacid dehydrogenase [Halobacillus faecis]|uniref:Dihydrofolate reductase n=1 Tax=Halobacillus faecis TaxID=360184 RepID=A0A511WTQ2_9BACI|nr:D-2-hydroxyacid dehydrogenase [Halobacillus faecis]GEN54526.1 dihydrofolate reductase [Halobacillus faecis]
MIVSTSDEWRQTHVESWQRENKEEVFIYSCIEEVPLEVRKETDVLITFGNDLTKENIHDFESLKWIQLLSAGLEDLPFHELRKKKLLITNARGVHCRSMKEYVIGAMLHFEKHFHRFLQLKENRVWERETLVGELVDRKVLVFGTGTIGCEIGEAAQFFGMRIDGVNTKGSVKEPFERVYTMAEGLERLEEYDYVLSVLPYTPSTKNIFSDEVLGRLHSEAVFMNLGRGGVVDEESLAVHLKEKKIKGAVLDVFVEEPLPRDHAFWGLPNLLLTPHMSAKSDHYMTRCMEILLENYRNFTRNESHRMRNLVDLAKYY